MGALLRRVVSQNEVAFDIDANEILDVSTQDKSTVKLTRQKKKNKIVKKTDKIGQKSLNQSAKQ